MGNYYDDESITFDEIIAILSRLRIVSYRETTGGNRRVLFEAGMSPEEYNKFKELFDDE